ncbi:hypothetical protein Tco_0642410, partial [Tanacetum coccineum]
DTIQLENAVSTISQEYLLEFTSEYDIPEDLHPEFPGPEDTIVDFPEGKVGVYTRRDSIGHMSYPYLKTARSPIMPSRAESEILSGGRHMDLFNLISAPNPTKVKTETRPRAAHEVPLLTVTENCMIDMEDPVATATSSETPSLMDKSPLDFLSEDPPPMITNKGETEDQDPTVVPQEVPSAENTKVVPKVNLEKEIATMRPPINKKRRKRDQSTMEANAPPKVLRKDHASVYPTQDTRGGKSLAAMGIFQENGHRDPYRRCHYYGGKHPVLRGEQGDRTLPSPLLGHRAVREKEIKRLGEEVESLKVVEMEVHGLRNQTKNLKTLLEAEVDMKKATEAKYGELAKELESLRAKVIGEERIKATFEEFKKYEDNKVEQRCAEMDARLDKLSVDIDEELYPHMLKTIAGRCWVIGHILRLAVMKCAKSSEIRQAFANIVSAGLAKGVSEGLKYDIEHGKASRDLADVEAYDPEANNKLVKALQDLKDLKYPMVDQLEKLKDAPISDGVPISVPTVAPQGLAILLADAATQTDIFEDEASPSVLHAPWESSLMHLTS